MNAMILAAGRGHRLRPITDERPKPLVEIGGVSLIERHLRRLADAGIDNVVINLGWLGEQIVDRIGSGAAFGLQVSYSPEYDAVLETGGGIRRALPMLCRMQDDEPFWVLNGDILTDYELPECGRAEELADDCIGHLILVPTPVYKSRGDFDLDNGRIRNADEPAYTFSGIALYRASIVSERPVERFSLVPLLREAADRGRLSGELHGGRWADVGTPERLADLVREAESG